MAYFVKRKDGESSDKAVNRWKKLTQRFARAVKGDIYEKRKPKKTKIRARALIREKYRSEASRKQFYS